MLNTQSLQIEGWFETSCLDEPPYKSSLTEMTVLSHSSHEDRFVQMLLQVMLSFQDLTITVVK